MHSNSKIEIKLVAARVTRLPGTSLPAASSEAGSRDVRPTDATGPVGVDKHMSTVSSAAVWDVLLPSVGLPSPPCPPVSSTTASD